MKTEAQKMSEAGYSLLFDTRKEVTNGIISWSYPVILCMGSEEIVALAEDYEGSENAENFFEWLGKTWDEVNPSVLANHSDYAALAEMQEDLED